jgi:type IV secretory pathway component VirB8
MKKLSDKEQKEFDLLQNEFLVNQEYVKNQIRSVQKQRNFALFFAAFVMLLSMVVVIISVNAASEAKHVDKVVFKEDGSGGLTYIGMATSKLDVKQTNYIRNQLLEYVNALYSIPTDQNQRQYNAYKVQFMTSVDYYSKYPQIVLKDNYINHGTELVGQVSPGVWEVDWSKFVNQAKVHDYKTMITFKQTDISTGGTEIDRFNPLGIVVTNIDTQERVSVP